MTSPTLKPAWTSLEKRFQALVESKQTISELFQQNGLRFDDYSITTPEIVFDYSKNLLTDECRQGLLDLAEQCQLPESIDAMFSGAKINATEQRPALHVALRGHHVGGLEQQVSTTLDTMEKFVHQVRTGAWKGASGQNISDVVNIGIGGSHLGPAMVVRALEHLSDNSIGCHFISNVDPAAGRRVLAKLSPATTLFIVASKSFSTLETHQNALMARQWYLDQGGDPDGLERHFVAVSSNIAAAVEFGINENNVFPMWDWVGGRYSLWSAIGLPIALYLGMDRFRELLRGAHHADEHFRTTPLAQNIPVIMGLLSVWYSGFFGTTSQAILPYSQDLELLTPFLQQLSMESLGKSVTVNGAATDIDSGAIIWGAPGTDGQHSFHQLLHQGTRMVPADFIAVAASSHQADTAQQTHLLANCFSQSQALMDGKTLQQATAELQAMGMTAAQIEYLAPHKVVPGNRPSNTLLLHRLEAHTLGYLVALYEHAVYVQSVIWNINAFDQWGVELGKQLSEPIYSALISEGQAKELDASTHNLVSICKTWMKS